MLSQPGGRPERSQRVGVTGAQELEQPADAVDPQSRRGVGFRPDGTLGTLNPGLRLLQPLLPGQYDCEYVAGDAGGRVLRPAVPPGQLKRLPAALRGLRIGAVDPGCRRLVGQAGELEKRARRGARSSRPAVTHAARCVRAGWLIQDRSRTVLPLPGGADTTVTRADPLSRSDNL